MRAMGFRCPQGHQSLNDEYCDVCGAVNPAHAMARAPTDHLGLAFGVGEQRCMVCGATRDGTDRYCANCGYDFEMQEPLLPQPQPAELAPMPRASASLPPDGAANAAPGLMLVVGVNPARFNEPDSPAPPVDVSERMFVIDRSPMLIGRDGPGLEIPIHGDPYVSRVHAEIVWMGSGWGIRDLGSTNGTKVNGVPVATSEVRPLRPEDVVELGFFSQLKVRTF